MLKNYIMAQIMNKNDIYETILYIQNYLNVFIRLIFDYHEYTYIINSVVLICFLSYRQSEMNSFS
jgi:hypothetical protein